VESATKHVQVRKTKNLLICRLFEKFRSPGEIRRLSRAQYSGSVNASVAERVTVNTAVLRIAHSSPQRGQSRVRIEFLIDCCSRN